MDRDLAACVQEVYADKTTGEEILVVHQTERGCNADQLEKAFEGRQFHRESKLRVKAECPAPASPPVVICGSGQSHIFNRQTMGGIALLGLLVIVAIRLLFFRRRKPESQASLNDIGNTFILVPYEAERDKWAVACAHKGTVLSSEPMTKAQAERWKDDLRRAVLALKTSTLP